MKAAEVRSIHLVVRGRVQGVGFRWYVREAARAAGLSGWVRNNPDGSVEVAAAGAPDDLAMLRSAIRRGPPGASVTMVDELPVSNNESLPFPFAVDR